MAASKLKTPQIDKLFEAILLLRDKEECYRFFEDICTVGEVQSMAQRLQVAEMLMAGNTYTEIAEVTTASTATISRVKRFLNYGSNGYKIILGRLNPVEEKKD